MARSHSARAFACATLLVASSTGLVQAEPFTGDLGHVLPGQVHGGLLSNLHLLMHDFPGIAHEGWLGDVFDEWVDKGYPDPREQVDQIALGVNIGGKKLVDCVFLARGPLRIVHKLRQLAEQAGLPLNTWAYRGVEFVIPLFERIPLSAAEISEGVSHFHYNRHNSFAVSKKLVETALGQNVSFGDKHGMSLTPVTYVVAGVQIPATTRKLLQDDPETHGIGLVGQAAVDWRRTGTKVQLGIELETFTPVEAELAARWCQGKLDRWIAKVTNEYLKAFLEAIEVRSVSNHVFLRVSYEWDTVREAFLEMNRMAFLMRESAD